VGSIKLFLGFKTINGNGLLKNTPVYSFFFSLTASYLKIKDYKIIDNYLKNNFETMVKVFGEYYYQNGFNVINLDSISNVK
tara:strand:+ start:343 stop:585 length:243 start_codon:yes stop_codon:yes gene_type:complete